MSRTATEDNVLAALDSRPVTAFYWQLSCSRPLTCFGAIAGGQRGYYKNIPGCGGVGTIAVTILAGPLNYAGVNPKVSCH